MMSTHLNRRDPEGVEGVENMSGMLGVFGKQVRDFSL